MKRLLTVLLFLSFGLLSYAQGKTSEIYTYKNGDTSAWFGWRQKDFKQMGLPDLTKSSDSLHFRFSTEIQAIDIWTEDYKTFAGTFANVTKSCNPDRSRKKRPAPEKLYCHIVNLDNSKAKQIYSVFTKLSIFAIPTEENIKGWCSGTDGTTYFIEYSNSSKYSFKTYWTPEVCKDKIPEAFTIDSLANQLETILSMRSSFNSFINSLPLGCYHAGGIVINRYKNK